MRRWVVLVLVMASLGVGLAYGIAELVAVRDDIERSDRDRADLRADLADQQTISSALAEQVRALGEEPVVEPDARPGIAGLPGAAGVDGLPGLPGLQGAVGPTGPQGPPGEDGEDGATGAAGQQGATGASGEAGAAGATGSTGSAGPAGPAGADGRDGRGVASVDCAGADETAFTITYSDGTTQTVTCTTSEPDTPAAEGQG